MSQAMNNPDKIMTDKICLVTGANAGIGKITASSLAKMGATVIMVARSKARGEAALADVRQASGSSDVHLLLGDLSSQASIRELAKTFKANYSQLHVLVNNAGAMFKDRQLSADGLEMTFALNHMGYFLLTDLLLDVLKASAPARIVNVSSDAHRNGRINFDDLQMEQTYRSFAAYSHSKLANMLYTYELARRLEGSDVTANTLHPGVVATQFGKGQGLMGWLFKIIRPFLLSPEQGAATQIYLASSPEVEGVSGNYYDKKKAVKSSKVSYDTAVAQRLWQVSEELISVGQ
ncbi:Retinol dehydrogenase 13 [hydrothermal vent metagenome]|uniref:Retinol dehydrogenase 13 n=1 Tax=hydrothermal vent metagenome TaxID=652676 RepID=A0A3B0V6Y1_9ZZZZ